MVEGGGEDFFGLAALVCVGAGAVVVAAGCAFVPSMASRKALRARICSSLSALARGAESKQAAQAHARSRKAQERGPSAQSRWLAKDRFESFIPSNYEKIGMLATRFDLGRTEPG